MAERSNALDCKSNDFGLREFESHSLCQFIPLFIIFAKSWKNTTEGLSDVIVGIDNDDLTYEEIKKEE